ncbi:MAG: hypothetical protein M9894_37370 [Planctomycetes bacterium]|nr:hypothetical protein [Planctomycetota bacterium]
MALSPDLLEILCCPEDRTPVKPADAGLVERLNAAIAAGKVKNRGGHPVTEAVQTALVREDGKVLYAVRDDIPVMIVDEGISVEGL